jgi:hydroxyacylglutathione hydrolase
MLQIAPLILGQLATNTYLIADSDTCEAAVIDPASDGQIILAEAKKHNWHIGQIWCTHAHFDHISGVGDLARGLETAPVIALHPADRTLWDLQGGAPLYGQFLPATPEPTLNLRDNLDLPLGHMRIRVHHTPGHTPGHCIFYAAESRVCFCGDLIFRNSVGRTDLPEGNFDALIRSIRSRVFTLPGETRLLPGHGPETTVGKEKSGNPFVRG